MYFRCQQGLGVHDVEVIDMCDVVFQTGKLQRLGGRLPGSPLGRRRLAEG